MKRVIYIEKTTRYSQRVRSL